MSMALKPKTKQLTLVVPKHLRANLISVMISSHQVLPSSLACCLVPTKNSAMAQMAETRPPRMVVMKMPTTFSIPSA